MTTTAETTAKPKLSPHARKILASVLRTIQRRPDTFDMDNWMTHDESVKGRSPYCGTVACLAGHIVLKAGTVAVDHTHYPIDSLKPWAYRRVPESYKEHPEGRHIGIAKMAGLILDIDRDTRNRLFHVSAWPLKFQRMYHGLDEDGGRLTPRPPIHRVAVARIRHWLKTGE